ncbi:DUF551 domain-containing protein [Advenella mimigardefordensis]|uniref:DUF551 domain-containing protein n=1 Tax=Advenella mimigardefordensis TaxID=302406 RepID=UPI00046D6CF1
MTQDKWISVDDRLPLSEQMIVVMRRNGRPFAGVYSEKKEYCIDRHTGHFVCGFTHWMPLQPPGDHP